MPADVSSFEGLLDRLGALASHTAGFAHADLLEDAEPAAHAKDEANPCLQDTSLSCIAEGQRGDSSEQHFQNLPTDTGFRAAFKTKLPSIICNGTVMVQSTYL